MVAPALIVLAVVAAYPIVFAIYLSTRRKILVFREDESIGLENYRFLFEDGRFWSSLGNTAYFTLVAVTLELCLGVAFALLLHRAVPGQRLLRASVLVPWAIPSVVSAKLWAWLFDAQHGLVTRALAMVLPLGDADILATPVWAMHAAIAVDVWKTTPFIALLALAGLKSIPEDVYRAAAIDGASAARLVFRIEIPMLRSTLVVAALLRALDAFRVFDAIYALTEGGPANTTETVSIYAYKTLMRSGDFGYGSTLAIATLICAAVIGIVGARLAERAGAS